MRNTFARVMTKIAQIRSDTFLLSGDIGNKMFDDYKEVAPMRFLNCGIAEGNMMSMAAGMALSGLRPIVYTITPFTTTRCLEQIRTGVAYHEAPVIIIGTGSGLSYSELGATHHSLEDIAIMRSIPNMQVCAPADSQELESQLKEALETAKPTYIRIGKKGEPNIFGEHSNLGIGKGNLIASGENTIVIGIGPIVSEALVAREKLKGKGIKLGVATMGSIKPLDASFLTKLIDEGYTKWITLEEHHKSGGLGSTLLEWLNDTNQKEIQLQRIGIQDHFIHKLGNQEYTRREEKIDSFEIIKIAESKWNY